MNGTLSNIRVLDMSRILAGPWSGQLLADMGAEVIKVERPGRGDDTRSWGPPYLQDNDGHETQESAYFLSANRGKKSITIDISNEKGQAIIKELAINSDVLIENYKMDGLAKYGLDYASLKEINPGLIYCSITGFGQTGPYKNRPGYDFLVQGMGGLMSVTGPKDEESDSGPQKAGVALADIMTGLYAAVAILAAINKRHETGLGQHIDLSLLDVQAGVLANQAMNYLVSGKAPTRSGNAHPNIVPYQSFATADGHIILTVGNDEQFTRYCEVINSPELVGDSRFATNSARVKNRQVLTSILQVKMRDKSSNQWLSLLQAANVSCGPINNIEQVFADPQIQHRGMKISMRHPHAEELEMVGNPIKFSDNPIQYTQPPPLLSEHTDAILKGLLGIDDNKLETLRREKVI